MKAHKRKVNMKFLFYPKKRERKENFSGSLRKLFYCAVHQPTCAQHAKSTEGELLYTRSSFRKREKVFLHYFLMEYSWEPCSMLLDGMCASQLCVRLSVVSFSGRRTYSLFPTVYISCFVSTIHNFRAVCTFRPTAKGKTENSQHKREEKKTFPTLNAFSKLLLRFSFSLHSLSVVCEHFIDLEQPNDICCSSPPHHSQCFSLTPDFSSSCKNNHVHDVNQLRAGWEGGFCVKKKKNSQR